MRIVRVRAVLHARMCARVRLCVRACLGCVYACDCVCVCLYMSMTTVVGFCAVASWLTCVFVGAAATNRTKHMDLVCTRFVTDDLASLRKITREMLVRKGPSTL